MSASSRHPVTFQQGERRLHGERFGPSGPVKALFIHGWLDNLASFDELLPLIEDDVPGVRIDLSGHGFSQGYPQSIHDITAVDWILDVVSVCHTLSKDPLVLVGHSLGAGICSMVAGLVPASVRGLILIDGLIPLPAQEDEFCERFRSFLGAKEKSLGRQPKVYPNIEAITQARIKAGEITPGLAKAIVQRNVTLGESGYTWATDPRLKLPTILRLTKGQIHSVLREITCETVLFRATQRVIEVDDEVFRSFAKTISHLEVHELETGHYPHGEEPAPIAARIKTMVTTH